MRLFSSALCTAVAVGLLAGCAGSNLGSTSSIPSAGNAQSHLINGHFYPQWSHLASLVPPELRVQGPASVLKKLEPLKKKSKGGIYASEFYDTYIWGYPNPNSNNGPATCDVSGVSYPNGIAVDGKGNLIDPDGGTRTVIIFKGPGLCGSELGSFSDPYGQPADASSANAATGTVIVGNIFDNSDASGSISVCTLSGGCTANLTNSNMYEVAGVALAKNGDCWASATNSDGDATLTYFKGCTGSGTAATGFENSYYGGLDIDKKGNLVSISAFNSELYVYSGCNPACKVVGGPFSLHEEAVFGHLDKKSKNFADGDFDLGEIDVGKYSPTKYTYSYYFNNGLSASETVEGAAFDPRSKE